LDAELEAKRKAQYDPALEADSKKWIESMIGESIGDDLHEVSSFV
jgi:hypothetical protein